MSGVVYDVPISEVARLLSKSDRQVRRYVKERRLKAQPVRIEGHTKLMFSRDEVERFKERFAADGVFGEFGNQVVVDAQLIEGSPRPDAEEVGAPDSSELGAGDSSAVKYVIDAMREQIRGLRTENRDLHYQLEQRSGQVGFLQGKVETLQEEMKMLMPSPKAQEELAARKPWYKRLFGKE
jgi:hypothetical protein